MRTKDTLQYALAFIHVQPRWYMVIRYCVITLIIFLLTGCSSPGVIYTNITQPYTTSFNNSTVGTKVCRVNTHRLKDPISRVGVSGEWSSKIIDKAMNEAGMEKCYYVDVKTLSLLLGTYRRTTLILYGD